MPYAGPAGISFPFRDVAAYLRGLLQKLHVRWSVEVSLMPGSISMNSPHDGVDLVLDHVVNIIVLVSSRHEFLLILLKVAMNRVCVEGCGVSDWMSAKSCRKQKRVSLQ